MDHVSVPDLHDLDIKNDLGIGPVSRRYHLLSQLDDIRFVTDNHGIQFLMNIYFLQLQHGSQEIKNLFCINVGQIKNLNDLVLVLPDLFSIIGIDNDCLLVENFFPPGCSFSKVIPEPGKRLHFQLYRDPAGGHILVKNKIDA